MEPLRLKVISPSGMILDTDAGMVGLPGENGPFTILEGHAPLIAALRKGDIVYQRDGEEKHMPIDSGFAEVADDEIQVCID
ncbi:MAG: hypothetical protein RR346_05845 [Bacteroidales bacterium]